MAPLAFLVIVSVSFVLFAVSVRDMAFALPREGRILQERRGTKKDRILYIVTTLAEYNTGTRATVKGSDRLQETLIPVVSEGVHSMQQAGYDVDVYLVCHFTLTKEREALVRSRLPHNVGLEVWNDASPIGYDTAKDKATKVYPHTIHLSRQHRFVIKDKFPYYDIFVNFEDDMIIHGAHIEHFVAVTNELQRLQKDAPEELPDGIDRSNVEQSFSGVLTKQQLRRMLPGFIRVEVLLDEENYGVSPDPGPIPIDLSFDGSQREVDAKVCCHVEPSTANDHIPQSPDASQLMIWETGVFALGIREMPSSSWLDWVVLLRGPSHNKMDENRIVGDFWSNRDSHYWPDKKRRPKPGEFNYINNQGGWMATRDQLIEWHIHQCPGGFLPPYEAPHYRFDGLDMRNVEWYSGGMQLSTERHACNMQRIVALAPQNFSKSLLYHSANNKQRQLSWKKSSFTKANTMVGQLNAVKKRALSEM